MDAPALRAFVREVLLDPDALHVLTRGSNPAGRIADALLQRAAANNPAWRPKAPNSDAVESALTFIAAARRIHQADPQEVDGFLRQGIKASLAGHHEFAREIFGALLPMLQDGEVDLGQHELVDEVLTVSLNECVSRYLLAIFLTTPVGSRADALFDGLQVTSGLGYHREPLAELERVSGKPLPDVATFLPLWIRRLEREPKPKSEWETEPEGWHREAVARAEGESGLARLARTSKRAQALRAWCEAVRSKGDARNTLAAYDEAVGLLPVGSAWSGEFLDGAALAAMQVGEPVALLERLDSAWRGAPSLPRILRWLSAGSPAAGVLRQRAEEALPDCDSKAGRLKALLHLIVGDARAAGKLLARAPGLGWSSDEHPGHVAFPGLVWMFGKAPEASARDRVTRSLHSQTVGPLLEGLGAVAPGAALVTPTVAEILERAGARGSLSPAGQRAALDALRAAAEARVEGVLRDKRRRHYETAAELAACCAELESLAAGGRESSAWFEKLRHRTGRFPAFQAALRGAIGEASRETTGGYRGRR